MIFCCFRPDRKGELDLMWRLCKRLLCAMWTDLAFELDEIQNRPDRAIILASKQPSVDAMWFCR